MERKEGEEKKDPIGDPVAASAPVEPQDNNATPQQLQALTGAVRRLDIVNRRNIRLPPRRQTLPAQAPDGGFDTTEEKTDIVNALIEERKMGVRLSKPEKSKLMQRRNKKKKNNEDKKY
tara:strand:- start:1249 stop:1605 length:357 start_codon:yes stop_codon:yes gene_type:complete